MNKGALTSSPGSGTMSGLGSVPVMELVKDNETPVQRSDYRPLPIEIGTDKLYELTKPQLAQLTPYEIIYSTPVDSTNPCPLFLVLPGSERRSTH